MGHEIKSVWRALVVGPVSIAVAVALSACGSTPAPGSAGQPTSPATTSTSPVETTTATTAPSAMLTGIPVYWIADSRKSFSLYREFRDVPDVGGPIASAVSAMTSLKPLDPDYMTPWRAASRVTVSQKGDAITVDLSRDAFSNTQVGSELADRAVQQLVYTATAAALKAGTPATTVKITADGAAIDVWGVIQIGAPMQRTPMSAVQAHIWVTSPQEGEDLPAGTATFKGFGTSFEANFLWEVRNQSGAMVAKGYAMGGTGDGGFGEFTFTAKLSAGTYSVTVSTDDASGGAEGAGPAVDNKTFTVH
ncbi:MAG: hypothetical protein HHJ11_06500 [Phycicoccus sp.]|nr:hypothetical protein [Phycicoccus sp.]NMM34461.1 hypothetical protein [Phycicoccus sp.]